MATPETNLTGATFTLPQLQSMYSAGTPETAGNGVTYAPFGGPAGLPSGDKPIDLYVPQAGSGTRTYWLQQMDGGTAPTTLPNWVFATIQSDGGDTPAAFVGQTVEENDGTTVSADPNGIFPFVRFVLHRAVEGGRSLGYPLGDAGAD